VSAVVNRVMMNLNERLMIAVALATVIVRATEWMIETAIVIVNETVIVSATVRETTSLLERLQIVGENDATTIGRRVMSEIERYMMSVNDATTIERHVMSESHVMIEIEIATEIVNQGVIVTEIVSATATANDTPALESALDATATRTAAPTAIVVPAMIESAPRVTSAVSTTKSTSRGAIERSYRERKRACMTCLVVVSTSQVT